MTAMLEALAAAAELSAAHGAARCPTRVLLSEDVALIGPRVTGGRRGGRNMHSFVFRSYSQIVHSDETDEIRDVRLDIDKAQTKLKTVRRQLQRDREHA